MSDKKRNETEHDQAPTVREGTAEPPDLEVGGGEPDHERAVTVKERAPEAEADDVVITAAYVTELERRVAEQDRRLRQTLSAYRSQEEEFNKIRERLERDRERKLVQDRVTLFESFLVPLDNLERSIAACREAGEAETLVQGVELVRKQFLDALAALGLERYEPTGKQFDPVWHEAMAVMPTLDPAQDDVVAAVHEAGYRYGTQVVRPARVVVSKVKQ